MPRIPRLAHAEFETGVDLAKSQLPITRAVSMGRRNTRPKPYLRVFQWLNSFSSVDSKKTLRCVGLMEYGELLSGLPKLRVREAPVLVATHEGWRIRIVAGGAIKNLFNALA